MRHDQFSAGNFRRQNKTRYAIRIDEPPLVECIGGKQKKGLECRGRRALPGHAQRGVRPELRRGRGRAVGGALVTHALHRVAFRSRRPFGTNATRRYRLTQLRPSPMHVERIAELRKRTGEGALHLGQCCARGGRKRAALFLVFLARRLHRTICFFEVRCGHFTLSSSGCNEYGPYTQRPSRDWRRKNHDTNEIPYSSRCLTTGKRKRSGHHPCTFEYLRVSILFSPNGKHSRISRGLPDLSWGA